MWVAIDIFYWFEVLRNGFIQLFLLFVRNSIIKKSKLLLRNCANIVVLINHFSRMRNVEKFFNKFRKREKNSLSLRTHINFNGPGWQLLFFSPFTRLYDLRFCASKIYTSKKYGFACVTLASVELIEIAFVKWWRMYSNRISANSLNFSLFLALMSASNAIIYLISFVRSFILLWLANYRLVNFESKHVCNKMFRDSFKKKQIAIDMESNEQKRTNELPTKRFKAKQKC